MFNKILVVCVGNICRSPTAERLLKHYQPELTVESAGLGALVGKAADERATSVARDHNLSLDGHIARQVTGRMCREYDLIWQWKNAIFMRYAISHRRCAAR